MTPYAVQARLLKTMARELALDRDRLTISTVHRYQGSEVDVVHLLADRRQIRSGPCLH